MPAVVTPTATPYKVVCLLLCYEDGGRPPWVGTGTLIGGNRTIEGAYVLTCAHNLVSDEGGRHSATRIHVFPHFSVLNQRPRPLSGHSVAHGIYPLRWANYFRKAYNWDIALLKLDIPIRQGGNADNYQPHDYMRPTAIEFGEAPPQPLSLAGYPGTHQLQMWEYEERWTQFNVGQHTIFYPHDTEPGTSGSPVYLCVRGNPPNLYAVHGYEGKSTGKAEESKGGVGVLITRETHEFISRAINILETGRLPELLCGIPPA